MPFLAVHLVLMFFLDLVQVLIRSKQDQALEVLVLRHQLRIALRQAPSPPRLSRWEKVTLAAPGVVAEKPIHLALRGSRIGVMETTQDRGCAHPAAPLAARCLCRGCFGNLLRQALVRLKYRTSVPGSCT